MPGPGLEAHEAVGLGRGRLDHLPDVDPHAVGQHRQLVDERDVDRAEDVLQQLRQLRRLRARRRARPVADEAVELLGALARRPRVRPADHLRRVAQREVGAAGVDALGREGEMEVAARRQPRLLEQRRDPLARGARVGGRLEHDQLAGLQHLRRARAWRRSAGRGPARGCASAASARRSAPRRPSPAARSAVVAWMRSATAAQRVVWRRPRCRTPRPRSRRPCARRRRRRPRRSPRSANATASGKPT